MPSAIDPTQPATGDAASEAAQRANWAAAKAEIEALQDTAGAALNAKAAFGAVGDGAADDTAALQAAIDAGLPLWLPPGDYRITAPLTYNKTLVMRGALGKQTDGEAFSRIRGDFAGPLLHRQGIHVDHNDTVVGTIVGTLVNGPIIEDVVFDNHHADGSCVQTYNCHAPVAFVRCEFAFRFRGLMLLQAFDATVINCTFNADPLDPERAGHFTVEDDDAYVSRAYGLVSSSHTLVTGCGFKGCGTGAFLFGAESNFVSNRIEVCGYGLKLGGPSLSPETLGVNTGLQRSVVSGISLESNARNLLLNNIADDVEIEGIGIQGGTNGPAADRKSLYGVRVAKVEGKSSFLSEVSAGGFFKQAAFLFDVPIPFRGLEGNNSEATGAVYAGTLPLVSRRNGHLAYRLDGAPINPLVNGALADEGLRRITAFSDLQLRGLVGLNVAEPHVQANNLGGVATVSATATSVAVSFPGQIDPNTGGFNSVPTAVTDGTSTLQAGTYWYVITTVTKRGETGYSAAPSPTHRSVAVSSGQRVDMTFHGVGAAVRRRVYCGRTADSFEGFWDLAGNANSFSDTGNMAFSGRDWPAAGGINIPAQTEADANYRIVATPNWNTTVWVTNRTTGGFTINFGTAAPANAECTWVLIRP